MHAYRGYLLDTGQEFINSRELGEDSEAVEFDTGMGVLPEAIDMSGTVCLLQKAAASCQHQGTLLRSAVTQLAADAVHRSFGVKYISKHSPDYWTVYAYTTMLPCCCSTIDDTWGGFHNHKHQPVCL